jgi:hypothetical protein
MCVEEQMKIDMENRIQINGTWYVKEDSIPQPAPMAPKFDAALATHFEGYVYETDEYCWEATRIYKDGNKEFYDRTLWYDGITIEFTNKSTKEVEYWDNDGWIKNVLHKDEEALEGACESMNDNGIATFKLFISFLICQGWLK